MGDNLTEGHTSTQTHQSVGIQTHTQAPTVAKQHHLEAKLVIYGHHLICYNPTRVLYYYLLI